MLTFFPNRRVFGLQLANNSFRLLALAGGSEPFEVASVYVKQLEHSPWLKNGLNDKQHLISILKEAKASSQPQPVEVNQAVCSIPETHVFSKVIELPRLSNRELAQAIPYEVAEFLPLPLNQVYLDWQVEELFKAPDGQEMGHILVVATPKKIVDDLIEITKAASLTIASIESEPFAMTRSIAQRLSPKAASLVLHINETITTLVIADSQAIRFISTALVGTRKLNVELATNLAIIVEEIADSSEYYRNRLGLVKEIDKIILIGEGASLPGLPKLLKSRTSFPVEIGHPPIDLPTQEAVSPTFSVVSGLAMWHKPWEIF